MACGICKKPCTPSTEDNAFHSDDKPHVCNKCGKGFSLKIQLKRHLLFHEGDVPRICITCEKHLEENSYNLRLSQKGNFTCETCKKCFTSKRLLLRHASEHTLENILYCEECGECFKNVTALKRHSGIHRSKKSYPKANFTEKSVSETPYICKECGKTFNQLQQYEKHCLSHQKHKCGVCHMVFTSIKLLDKHQNNGSCQSKITNSSMDSSNFSSDNLNSSNSDDKKHVCIICNKSFTRKSALEGHMMASHLSENRESAVEDDSDNDVDYQCNFKGDKFNEESKRMYLPKLKIRRTFQCEKCEMVCASKRALNTHMLCHQNITDNCAFEGKKNYICRICNETFISKDDYKKHKATHDAKQIEEKSSMGKEQKSYICEMCDKVFAKRKHLKKHIKCHSIGEDSHENDSVSSEDFQGGKRRKRVKNFSCSFCGKLFAGEICLKKHEAKHADDDKEDSVNKGKKGKKPKRLICEICNEDFTGRRHVYIKHKLSHTPEVCGICDARFPDRASLREHCRVHIGTEEGRRFIECSQKALDAKNGIVPPEPKVEYIYLVLR